MDKIITQTVTLNGSPSEAFEMFTVNGHVEKWLATKAFVEPAPGGKYELFWDPSNLQENSTIGCKVLAVEAPYFLNFEWKGAKQHSHFMNTGRPLTNVAVSFIPLENKTKIVLMHTGWKDTQEWEEARQWFDTAWRDCFKQLQKQFNTQETV